MRLSSVLSDAPDATEVQVEGFLGQNRLRPGTHRAVEIGTVVRYYFCHNCGKKVDFRSTGKKLSCLITGERTVSLDVLLRCSRCEEPAEAWFLVACVDDLFSQSPKVQLETYRETSSRLRALNSYVDDPFEDMFERARVAFESGLGAGAMIYLRKIYEMVASMAATDAGISTESRSGRRKAFFKLLTEVDSELGIVPREFSQNGYKLFGELSDVIHGTSDEVEALEKYVPCRSLVQGIADSFQRRKSHAEAAKMLGWSSAQSGNGGLV